MPNDFAYLTLLAWPIISIVLYTKYPVIAATFWTIVGGYLLLPVGVEFDFPFIPPLDKKSIPAIMAFIGCRYIAKHKIKFLPLPGIERKLILLLFLGSVATVLTNGEPVVESGRYIPGLSFHDTLSTVIFQWLMLIPFIIGIQIIKTHEDQVQLLRLIVIAGLWYSLLIIFEIRMSPQLHNWVYGFFPNSWGQQLRYGGFRPVVFLGHGLWVSIFLFTVFGSIVSLSRLKLQTFLIPNKVILSYFFILLILSKGLGAIILGLTLFLCVMSVKHIWILKGSIILALIAMSYPLLCIADLFPHQQLIDLIGSLDISRAESLKYRFDQEIMLLDRAKEKLMFGWGGWDRNRLEDSVTDGYWIILVGKYGLIGFVAIFGLSFNAVWRTKAIFSSIVEKKHKDFIVGSLLTITFLLIDQIPNASVNPLLWLLVGGHLGRLKSFGRSLHLHDVNPSPVNPFKKTGL